MDDTVTVAVMKQRVQAFCEARDWDQFHSAKELGIGLITEAAELLEQFRFLEADQERELLASEVKRGELAEELADVLFFILRFAQRFDFDLHESLERKIEMNEQRYPVEKARGRNVKYSEL